ncbi:MAG: hypothetical protein K1X88_28530 [Nannocystaceae bacterium]|nr:hypothetical protein [Nannocystaceae bacterium]
MRARATWWLVPTLGCSTLAPEPTPQECRDDTDCTVAGEVCAPDTNVCVPGEKLPPVADLAFDLQELEGAQVVFRAEVGGCDAETGFTAANKELTITRNQLQQTFELSVFVRTPVDPTMPTLDDLMVGEIELSQLSRLGRSPTTTPRIDYPTTDGADMPTLLPTTVRWPRYHPYDAMPAALAGGGFVQWRSLPAAAAPLLAMIVPPVGDAANACERDDQCGPAPNFCIPTLGQCSLIGNPRFALGVQYADDCSRVLKGRLELVDPETLTPVVDGSGNPLGAAGASIRIRHADTDGAPRLGVFALGGEAPEQREPQCSSDAQCIAGEQFCDPVSEQCLMALAGRSADGGTIVTDSVGAFEAPVYTYCEREGNVGLVRSFTMTAAPGGPVASVNYEFDVQFPPISMGQPKPEVTLRDLCVPSWGAAQQVGLALAGEPVTLLGSGEGAFRCCDIGCLPRTPEDAMAMPEPTQLDTCDGRSSSGAVPSATVEAQLVLDAQAQDAWAQAGCLTPQVGPGGVVGGLRQSVECSGALGSDATCLVPDLAAGKDGGARQYSVRIESPVGSLLGSLATDMAVDPQTASAPVDFALPRRVLVRGRVVLDEATCAELAPADGDCGSEGAVVLAERLRMPAETAQNVPGPYYHEVQTFYDPVASRRGGYVLPLDPGVWVVTALPLPGSQGGPADIAVLDLRDGKDVQREFVLDSGVLVTLNVAGFDRSVQVLPLDRGSWRDLVHPGRVDDPAPNLDLNAIGECLSPASDPPQACRIRRLVAAAGVSASQIGQVRFAARSDPGAGSCPN